MPNMTSASTPSRSMSAILSSGSAGRRMPLRPSAKRPVDAMTSTRWFCPGTYFCPAEPRRPVRAVARDLVLLHADAGEVENHEVGHHALAHEAAVGQAHDAGRLEGEAPDGILERQELALAHPLAQHVARLARGAEVGVEVGAGVRL